MIFFIDDVTVFESLNNRKKGKRVVQNFKVKKLKIYIFISIQKF